VALRDRRLAQLILFGGFAVFHTWPLPSAPASWSRMDNADTALNAWIVAWVAHQLPRSPLHLFDANIFYPEPRTLAFSEHMVVQGVMGLPLFALGASAVLAYNLLAIAGFALSGYAMSQLVARWTGSAAAGIVAGLAYAFNALSLVGFTHLQALHVEFLPPAMVALHDLVDRPAWRHAFRLFVWATLQALTSNYLLASTIVAMAIACAACPSAWVGSGGARRTVRLAGAAVLSAAVLLPFLLPYYYAKRDQGLVRPTEEVAYYSGEWRDYLATGGRLHYEAWSERYFEGATPLFPGLAVLALSVVALSGAHVWRDRRARSAIAVAVAGVALSFGMTLPGYRWLYDHVPLLQGLRAPVRFGWLWLFALAILAGHGLARLERGLTRRARLTVTAAAIALVTVEASRVPVPFTRFDGLSPIYPHVAALPSAVLAEIPFAPVNAMQYNALYVLASTTHFHPLLNGYSGFTPASYHVHAGIASRLPDERAFDALAAIGVTHVVAHGSRLDAEDVAALDASRRLSLVAREGDDRLYRLVSDEADLRK
jgi:hypothetical protein